MPRGSGRCLVMVVKQISRAAAHHDLLAMKVAVVVVMRQGEEEQELVVVVVEVALQTASMGPPPLVAAFVPCHSQTGQAFGRYVCSFERSR